MGKRLFMSRKQLQKLMKRATSLALITLTMGASQAPTISPAQAIAERAFGTSDSGFINLSVAELIAEAQLLAQTQQPRTALVIGNAVYEDAPLRNPVNDATAIKGALESLGFQVTLLTNQDWHSMDRAIEDFSEKLQPGSVALFYYSGHGIQVDGENYLVPVGAQLNRERHAKSQAISLSDILKFLEDAETAVNIVIIDACRDNPFYRRWRSSSGSGLAEVESPPEGTIISFATEPGNVAEDGHGAYSPFTAALLEHINEPDLDIGIMFRRVRVTVLDTTEGFQRPRTDVALNGEFFLNPSRNIATPLPSQPSPVPPIAISPVQEITPPSQQSPPNPPTAPTLISAATGVNYQPLRDALAAGNFREADGLTTSLMIQASGGETENGFRFDGFLNISCEDFRILDQLWSDYSSGKFGFSIQLEIYQSLGGGVENARVISNFKNRIGWKVNNRTIDYREMTFNTSAPAGHLPTLHTGHDWFEIGHFIYWVLWYSKFPSCGDM